MFNLKGFGKILILLLSIFVVISCQRNPISRVTNEIEPNAPSNLTATYISADIVELRWFDNSQIEIGYEIEQSINNDIFSYLVTTPPNITVKRIQVSDSLASYRFRIRAILPTGFSAYSNVAQAHHAIEIVWKRRYSIGEFRDIIQTYDRNYIFIGNYPQDPWSRTLYYSIVKINSEGPQIWRTDISDTNHLISSVVEMNSRDLLITGRVTRNNSDDGFILVINPNGQVIRRNYLLRIPIYKIIRNDDDGFIGLGSYLSFSFPIYRLIKLDNQANLEWYIEYDDIDIKKIIKHTSYLYSIGGRKFVKLNLQGDVLLGRDFSNNLQFNDFCKTIDNHFIIVGRKLPYPYTPWMVKLNESGEEVWQREIIDEDSLQSLVSIATSSNFNHWIIGYKWYNSPTKSVFLKIDENGNIIKRRSFYSQRIERILTISHNEFIATSIDYPHIEVMRLYEPD